MYRLNNDITRAIEANSLKGPIPGIVTIMCCSNNLGKIQLVTTQAGTMKCGECGREHEITKAMLDAGVTK